MKPIPLVFKSTGIRPRFRLYRLHLPTGLLCDGDNVEVVELFIYLGVNIHNTESAKHDIGKCIAKAWNCMSCLDCNIWHSSITLATKLWLYRVFILPQVSCHSLWSTRSTTIEKHWWISSVVSALHITNFLEGLHLKRRGLQTTPDYCRPATTHAHHPYNTYQVLWTHRTCWSIHGPQPSTQMATIV